MSEYKEDLSFKENTKNEIYLGLFDLLSYGLDVLINYAKTKIDKTPEKLNDAETKILQKLNAPEAKNEMVSQWSNELYEKGLIGQSERGLPDELIISNIRQEGYLTGIFAGYYLSMMALANNNVPEELILPIRDEMRTHLVGHLYKDYHEIKNQFEDEKYIWIDKLKDESPT